MTSHDVVAHARRVLGERRIGHAGTLDPDATGVLVLGVGRATRLLRFATALPKSYEGEVVFGVATSTLDASGEVTATFEMTGLDLDVVSRAAQSFIGSIEQMPPMVSAVKIGGRRLHEIAREGIEVERALRPVEVFRFEVATTKDPMVYSLAVDCSSGTYVRVLAAELGAALGGGAHLRHLRRTAVGQFKLGESVALDALDKSALRPAKELVSHLAQTTVDDDIAAAVSHGRALERRQLGVSGDGPWAVAGESDDLLAVYAQTTVERLKPLVVVADASRRSGAPRR